MGSWSVLSRTECRGWDKINSELLSFVQSEGFLHKIPPILNRLTKMGKYLCVKSVLLDLNHARARLKPVNGEASKYLTWFNILWDKMRKIFFLYSTHLCTVHAPIMDAASDKKLIFSHEPRLIFKRGMK